jgi:hypothetical protein
MWRRHAVHIPPVEIRGLFSGGDTLRYVLYRKIQR